MEDKLSFEFHKYYEDLFFEEDLNFGKLYKTN